jgi:hypothetical protein
MEVVVFDASVLFKAAVTRFLLGAAQSGEFRAIWSELVLEEARRSLLAAHRPHAAAALEQNLDLVRDPVVGPSDAVEALLVLTGVGDRHVLAAAANGGASLLVTSNVRHFDPAEATSLGIVIRTPDELAASIAARNPHALTRHVQRTPPERLSRYVELLSRELPETMRMLAPQLDR